MTILERYLIKEVAKPLLVVFVVLILVFAGYSTAEFLGRAASGLLAPEVIAMLVGLKVSIACEVILPIATFLTLVIGLGRLNENHEATAMVFCGLKRYQRVKAIAKLVLVVAAIVGALSLALRPMAYDLSYQLRDAAEGRFDLDRLEAGTFFSDEEGRRCVFVDESESGPDAPPRIFVFLDDDDHPRALTAASADRQRESDTGREFLLFHDLEVYQLGGDKESMMVSTEELKLELPAPKIAKQGNRRKAASTLSLVGTGDPKELAELQWRLSRPISTFLLGLFAIVIASGRGRRDRYGRILLAILAYVVYFYLSAFARNQVEAGTIPAIPGLFWVDGLLAVVLIFFGLIMPRLTRSA